MSELFELRPGCVPDRVQVMCPACNKPLAEDRVLLADYRTGTKFHYDCFRQTVAPKRKIRWQVNREDWLIKKSREINEMARSWRKAKDELDKVKSELASAKDELDKVKSELASAKDELDKVELAERSDLLAADQ